MSCNSKNVRAVTEMFCASRSNLSESACQKSCESSDNWGIYEQKETYFKHSHKKQNDSLEGSLDRVLLRLNFSSQRY